MTHVALAPLSSSLQPDPIAGPAASLRDLAAMSATTGREAVANHPSFALDEWQIRLILPHRPPVLQLDRVERCVPAVGLLEASKALGGGDPMVQRDANGAARLSAGALIEALAQCSGLLLRLRWLADAGIDLVAFAAGETSEVERLDIPRSVLAESQARFVAPAQPGRVLRLATRLVLSRGNMHRFNATAHGAAEAVTAQIMLGFPSPG